VATYLPPYLSPSFINIVSGIMFLPFFLSKLFTRIIFA
jgi:hypothetical protein